MSATPFMPLYVADYLGDTQHLSVEQHGAYLLLLMAMWRAGGRLPSDPSKLARIVRLSTTKWLRIADDVMAFFDLDDGEITQKRLTVEHEKAAKKHERRVNAGSQGGKAKALKNKEVVPSNAKAKLCHSSEPEPHRYTDADASVVGEADPSAPDEVTLAFEAYNASAKAAGWPAAVKLDTRRRASLKARLAECGGIAGWREALARARASPHCCGQNDRGWTADLDFLLQPKSFNRLREGSYDARKPPAAGNSRANSRASSYDAFAAGFAAVAGGSHGGGGPDRPTGEDPGPGGAYAGATIDLEPRRGGDPFGDDDGWATRRDDGDADRLPRRLPGH